MKNVLSQSALLIIANALSGCGNARHYDPRNITAFTVIAAIISIFAILASYSNVLRDEVNNCDEFEANTQKIQLKQRARVSNKNPYSLTKVQFGLWTVIISSSYLYLALYKGDCSASAINKTAIVLMGIFAGTTAVSTIIDKHEMNDNRPRHQNTPSQGFFIDILSDDNGISLHRFQSFVWTLVAVTVYVYKLSYITTGCFLPELSDTLLALTGISNATFLVLRSKENDPPVEEAQKTVSETSRPPASMSTPSS